MSHASVGPGAPTVGPGGGLVGPTTITIEIPAAVITLTAPEPGVGTIHIDVPAAVLTLSAQSPSTAIAIPAASLTLTSTGPRTAYAIPAATLTLTPPVPAVRAGIVIPIPTATIELHSQPMVPLTSGRMGPLQVFLGHIEVEYAIESTIKTEEVLGGVGTAEMTIHAPNNPEFDPDPHVDVIVQIRSTGWRLFHGETLTPTFEIVPGRDYAVWTIPCRDYNGQLSERLVGAPNGTFWRPDVDTPFLDIDADAISGGTDKVTIQQWFRAYFRFPNGALPDLDTYVGEYVDNDFLGAPENIMWLYDALTDLQSAMAQLASAAEVNVQGWLMPDDKVAWLAIVPWQDLTAGADQGLLPSSPVALGTGGTTIRLHLTGTKDGQAMPQALYVRAASPAHFYDPSVSAFAVAGGSGWYPYQFRAPPATRQAYISAPGVWTEEAKNRFAASAYRRAQRFTFRASLTVIEENMGGFRAGMVQSVSDPRLPGSVQDGSGTGVFAIQRVVTTLLGGTNTFQTDLDVGDGAAGSISQYATRERSTVAGGATGNGPQPIRDWPADWSDFGWIKHGQTRQVTFAPKGPKGDPWGPPGILFEFEVQATDADGVVVPGEGSCDPSEIRSERDGKVRTTFHSSDTRDDLYYTVSLWTTIEPAL